MDPNKRRQKLLAAVETAEKRYHRALFETKEASENLARKESVLSDRIGALQLALSESIKHNEKMLIDAEREAIK